MVVMASDIASGRVRTMATESCKMVALLQEIGWETCTLGLYSTSLILDIHVMVNRHLSVQGIHLTWIKFIVYRGHVFFKLTADQVQVLFGSRAYDRLTCDKSRVVRKAVNASTGLKKLTEVWLFSSYIQMFFTAFCVLWGPGVSCSKAG